MTTFSTLALAYGSERINIEAPEDALAGALLEPRLLEYSDPNPRAAIQQALEDPEGRPLLREMIKGKLVGLVLPDGLSSALLDALVQEMAAELKAGEPKTVWIFFASGPHDPQLRGGVIGGSVRRHFRELAIPFKFFPHDCDRSPHTMLGTTSMGTEIQVETPLLKTEVRVYAHLIRHAYLAGYSTTDQLICPGMAHRISIQQNLRRSLSLLSQPGRNPWHPDPELQGNPVSEDAREFREMVDRCFIDSEGEVQEQDEPLPTFLLGMLASHAETYWARAGAPDALLPDLILRADEQSLFEVEKNPYVVVSPGAAPYGSSLYDVVDCLDLAVLGAIEAQGEALVLAPCDGGPEQPEEIRGLAPDERTKEGFWDSLTEIRDLPLSECYDWINENFSLHHWKTYRLLRLLKEAGVSIYIYSRLNPELVEEGGFLPCESVQSWVEERIQRKQGRVRLVNWGSQILVRGTYAEG